MNDMAPWALCIAVALAIGAAYIIGFCVGCKVAAELYEIAVSEAIERMRP